MDCQEQSFSYPEFKDEARRDALFSPLRSPTVNPKDWDTKMTAWRRIIEQYCSEKKIYSFTPSQLKKAFLRHGRPPSCLDAVVHDMLKKGELQSLEEFMKEAPRTWGSWAADLAIKKPLSWSYNAVKHSLFTQNVDEHVLVHIETVKSEADMVVAVVETNKSAHTVFAFSHLVLMVERNKDQADEVKLLLNWLVKKGKATKRCLKYGNDEHLLVKVGDRDVKPISEFDVGVYVLQQNQLALKEEVAKLEDDISSCVSEVKSHLLKNHRQLAKTCLKKKHGMEKRLTKKLDLLHNMHILHEKLKDVHTDAQIWESYKGALAAFNSTLKHSGLTEDAVEDTILKLEEVLDVHNDIQSSISKPLVDEDEADLERELEELTRPETPPPKVDDLDDSLLDELAKLDISTLPDVPIHNVSSQEVSLS